MSKVVEKKIVNCKVKFIRISPYKLRRVADVVRGLEVEKSISTLKNLPQKGARILLKAINSAKANAINNHDYNENDNLIISKVIIDEAPKFKRYQTRARGRMYQIIKRNSHITLEIKGVD
mgnify:CR=1 FL=1